MAVIQVQRKPLTLAERAYLPQIFGGMMTTIKHFLGPAETMEYPEQRPAIPPGYRGVPTLVMDPNGREKCVSCQLCEFVCPPKAIRIIPGSVAAGTGTDHVEKAPQAFDIDMLRCIYCGLCEEVCPEEAIFLQNAVLDVGLQPLGDGEPQGPALRAWRHASRHALQVGRQEGR